MHELEILEREVIKKLTNKAYVDRLDKILSNLYEERYGKEYINHGKELLKNSGSYLFPQIRELYQSDKIIHLEEKLQRKIIDNVFKFLIHLELGFFKPKIKNKSINDMLEQISLQKKSAIFLRTAIEYFFNIIFLIHKHKELKGKKETVTGKKSTIKSMKEFMKEEGNPFSYFAIFVYDIQYFDRKLRSPEVHTGSKLITNIVSMKGIEYAENDDIFIFNQQTSSLYKYLVESLKNDISGLPTGNFGCFSSEQRKKYFDLYFHKNNKNEFIEYIKELELISNQS